MACGGLSGSANLFKGVNVIDIRTKWFGNFRRFELSRVNFPGEGGGDSHMVQTEMLIGNFEFNPYRLVFTGYRVVVGVVIRRVERYDLVKIKPTESEAEH